MNIGIDIDDTITKTYETLIPIVAIKYGMNIDKLFKDKPSYKMLRGILPEYDTFIRENFTGIAKVLPLKDDVIEVLNQLRKQGHKLIFISARNYQEYEDPYKLSYEYLKSLNIPFDKLIVNAENKAKECVLENIDLFIDDNALHCKAVKNKGIKVIQMDTIFTENSKNLDRAYGWQDVYKKIQEMFS